MSAELALARVAWEAALTLVESAAALVRAEGARALAWERTLPTVEYFERAPAALASDAEYQASRRVLDAANAALDTARVRYERAQRAQSILT